MTQTPIDDMITQGASVVAMLAAGYKAEEIAVAAGKHAENSNREAQGKLNYNAPMPAPLWSPRKTWLLDGEKIHGPITDFFWPALAATRADDQAERSRQMDLLFKALYTILGEPPEPPQVVPPIVDPTPLENDPAKIIPPGMTQPFKGK